MSKVIKTSEILDFLDKIGESYVFVGEKDDAIVSFSSIYEYRTDTITWVRSQEIYQSAQEKKNETIKLIVTPNEFQEDNGCLNCIKTEDPHRVFFYILKEFFDSEKEIQSGTNNYISPSARITNSISIGNSCFVGEHVEIGEGSRIGNNVVINHNVKIGKNCLIQSGAVIGEDGFGFLTTKDQSRERVKHLGSVVIGDNVEIGSNTCIVRGVMGDTVIGDGTKIDNLCHIAHNVKIGRNGFIVAKTMVGGSVTIGDNCWLATSTIRNGIHIGNNALIGFGSVVVKDVEDDAVVYGNPAKKVR